MKFLAVFPLSDTKSRRGDEGGTAGKEASTVLSEEGASIPVTDPHFAVDDESAFPLLALPHEEFSCQLLIVMQPEFDMIS